jgi:glycosyltransferase involved in cell wall biosynthesis
MIVWNDFQNDARVLKEAETLQQAGYQVIVHALHTPGITKEQETLSSGIKVVRVSRSPFWKWRKTSSSVDSTPSGPIGKMSLKRRILRIIARLYTHAMLGIKMLQAKPDIIHAHDVNTLPTAYLASIFARVPIVYDAHEISTSREGYSSFRALVYYIEKYLMPRVTASLTTTNMRAKFFARVYGIKRPLVLQNRPRFTELERTNKIRTELQLEHDWPIVLYQGGLQQGRGLERVIDAATHIHNAYFVLIGFGRLEAVLKNKVAALQLQDRIYFIPKVSLQLLPYYSASADIGLQVLENTCLNHYSTDSNKLFEYIMAGLPIIVSRLPEMSKIVQKYDLGLLIEADNTNALVLALRKLIMDPTLRKHYADQALCAAQCLSWESQEDAFIHLYQNLLK